jgi:hypothetical protein
MWLVVSAIRIIRQVEIYLEFAIGEWYRFQVASSRVCFDPAQAVDERQEVAVFVDIDGQFGRLPLYFETKFSIPLEGLEITGRSLQQEFFFLNIFVHLDFQT